MLGNNYAPEFFDGVNDKVASPLKRICEETLEDLEGYKEILQQFGVEVIQPELDPNEKFLDNPHIYPRGPLQPRDAQLILGNDAYYNPIPDHPAIKTALENYGSLQSLTEPGCPNVLAEKYYNFIAGSDYPTYKDFVKNRLNRHFFKDFVWEELVSQYAAHSHFSSANSFMLGKKLIISLPAEYTNECLQEMEEKTHLYEVVPTLKEFDVYFTSMDGHADGNYHPIKPGAILSLCDVQNYNDTFPGWDVCYLQDQSWSKVKGFLHLKEKNQGKWWLAGEEDNDEFIYFVETWLQDWVGYVEETVFDVNVLMLDEHHCCVSNPHNEQVNAFLKKHKVEPVYVPWRHRFFWDGGLHCITLDLYREGVQKEYFE
jgi:hypothetical protein